MRKSVRVISWAVYQSTILGEPGPNVVCDQAEWDAIEQAQPGLHRLIKGGIKNEGEAERLARGTSGDDKRAYRKKEILALLAPVASAIGPDEEERGGEAPEEAYPVVLPFPALLKDITELAVPDVPPGGLMGCA